MAHIETWWRCPGCKAAYDSQREAESCARKHVWPEQWAVSHKYPGKAVKVTMNRGVEQALREAEESDNIKPRAKKETNRNEQIQQGFIRLVQG